MKCTLHVCLRNGSGARKSPSEQMENPASVSSSVVFESSVRRERPLWTRSVLQVTDSASNGTAGRAILTVGGLVRTTKAVVKENVLDCRDAGPRLVAWVVHHAAQVICARMVRADGLTPFRRSKERKSGTPLAGFGERVWLRDPCSGKSEQVQPEMHRGEVALKSSRYIVPDFDGMFRMVRTVKRATADDRWKNVSPRILSRPPIWSRRQLSSHVRGETRGEVNPAAQRLERHPVDAPPPDPNRDPVPRRLYLKQSDSMPRSRSIRGPMTLLSFVPGGLPKSSVVIAVTNTSTSLRRLTWR